MGHYCGDATPNNNDGTATGTTATTDRHGQANKALSFNGTSDYITLPNIDLLANFTLAGWVNWNGSVGGLVIDQELGCVDYPTYNMRVTNEGKVRGYLYRNNSAGGAQSVTSVLSITSGVWNFLSVTYDGSNLRVYINGLLDNTTINVISSWNSTRPTTIGAGDSQGGCGDLYSPFPGKIADVRVYNRALSPTEVAQLYNEYR